MLSGISLVFSEHTIQHVLIGTVLKKLRSMHQFKQSSYSMFSLYIDKFFFTINMILNKRIFQNLTNKIMSRIPSGWSKHPAWTKISTIIWLIQRQWIQFTYSLCFILKCAICWSFHSFSIFVHPQCIFLNCYCFAISASTPTYAKLYVGSVKFQPLHV